MRTRDPPRGRYAPRNTRKQGRYPPNVFQCSKMFFSTLYRISPAYVICSLPTLILPGTLQGFFAIKRYKFTMWTEPPPNGHECVSSDLSSSQFSLSSPLSELSPTVERTSPLSSTWRMQAGLIRTAALPQNSRQSWRTMAQILLESVSGPALATPSTAWRTVLHWRSALLQQGWLCWSTFIIVTHVRRAIVSLVNYGKSSPILGADPGKQAIPSSWPKDLAGLNTQIYTYVFLTDWDRNEIYLLESDIQTVL